MNKYIKNSIATTALAGVILSSVTGAYAMSEEEFKKELLSQIGIEENLTDAELMELNEELSDVSKGEILASLKKEISDLDNSVLESALKNELTALNNIQSGDEFFIAIDSIYEKLDSYYEESGDDKFEYNFKEEKGYIIMSINEEKQYIDDKNLNLEIDKAIILLQAESDENVFFDMLNALYEKVDTHYGFEYGDKDGDNEYSFEDMKSDVLYELQEEKRYLDDEALKSEVDAVTKKLRSESKEKVFFDSLDVLYEKLNKHYKEHGIEILDGEDFNFDDAREDILKDFKGEISELLDGAFKVQMQGVVKKLEGETSENVFFDSLDAAYETLDEKYGHETLDEKYGHETLDEKYGHETLDEKYGHETLDEKYGHETLDEK